MCICEPQGLETFLCRDFSLALVWVREVLLNFSFTESAKVFSLLCLQAITPISSSVKF